MSDATHVASDVLHALRYVSAQSCRLAYLDPPFHVGVKFRARGADGTRARGPVAYTDTWPSLEAYCAWLLARAQVVWDCLSPDGTLWLHLDRRAVHTMKIALDGLLGAAAFQGEIVWVPGNGGRAKHGPNHTHQSLLVYAKSRKYIWNAHEPCMREPHAATSIRMHFTHKDETGRAFRERTVNGKLYRYAEDEGRAIGSVWLDCPSMVANSPLGTETTGYPTQKPLKLLDRIVRVSTNPGDRVIDGFTGSGTTLLAAAMANREGIGFDVGELSRQTCVARFQGANVRLDLR